MKRELLTLTAAIMLVASIPLLFNNPLVGLIAAIGSLPTYIYAQQKDTHR